MSTIVWEPSKRQIADANITAFARDAARAAGTSFPDYAALHRWSVENREAFWSALWDFCGVRAEKRGEVVLEDREAMPGARWFPEARLNFAENCLAWRGGADAIVFRGEDGSRRRLSRDQLYDAVSRCAQALKAAGIAAGDRLAALMPNVPETVIAALAAASIGAIFSSCSPDFGAEAVIDRFGQIGPRILFIGDGYSYNGRKANTLDKLEELAARLPTVEKIVIVPCLGLDGGANSRCVRWDDFVAPFKPGVIEFAQLPFDHPLCILYSSGTTGVPKCIVHRAGGVLLQHLKEHRLHSDIRADDRIFYFTTCGWMMWNWLVSGLASGATLLLYDGSPFYPNSATIFDYAQEERMTMFGTSAKYLEAIAKAGLKPAESHDLSHLRTICSTGSPLAPEGFDYVYASIKRDLCLSSISGGTDLVSCFALGNPALPVRRGELQCRGLGMSVEVWNDQGVAVRGEKGELVCTAPFPTMPLGFWNDPDGSKYRSAYFERFPGVWCHGDWAELTESGGMIIYGRSDATLNPGGVRIGTAEIYRQVERLDEVVEALAIGQESGTDVRIVLFVKLRDGLKLDSALKDKIREQIRINLTRRHVPALIIQAPDIPRTRNGKLMELAVRNLVHGVEVKNREAAANPEALDFFAAVPELKRRRER